MGDISQDDKNQSTLFTLSDLVKNYQQKPKNKYVSREYQGYGYFLSVELEDPTHKSLYIKMAKEIDRGILEAARSFVKDAQAKSKARLFMWKVKELQQKRKTTTNA